MKIYEIGTGYTPIPAQVAAATESVVEELTKAFIKKAQPVEILDISACNRAQHNLPITEIRVPSVFTKSDVSLGIVHKLKRVVYSLALASKLKKIIMNEKQKIILHFHNQYNLFFFLKTVPLKIRSKAVIAYTNHNGYWSKAWEEVEDILRKRYFQEIEAMKNADIVFVLNRNMKNNVVEHIGLPENKVVKINNGVNTHIYCPLPPEEKAQIKEKLGIGDKKVILQVGSVCENKGQVRSIEMLAPLLKSDESLVYAFAGGIVSQEYFAEVKSKSKELCIEEQVIYLGSASPGEEMNELYNIAEVSVFVSQYESFGLVCIESFSAGIPVVLCSNTVVDFGDGCIKCEKNEFADKVEQLLGSDCEIGEKARQNAVCNYSWNKIAQDYLDALA